jgi:peptide-methionine (S)-S-oxide reductase
MTRIHRIVAMVAALALVLAAVGATSLAAWGAVGPNAAALTAAPALASQGVSMLDDTFTPEKFEGTDGVPEGKSVAMFGAGCFWGVELRFENTEGVLDAVSGYAGGHKDQPTYKEVCFTDTGHAEVVRVVFDPEVITYEKLVRLFFELHDPTQLNRQGPDVGSQYRSVIFALDEDQKTTAKRIKAEVDDSGEHDRPVVTQVEDWPVFWKAEEYHQDYLKKRGVTSCSTGSGS